MRPDCGAESAAGRHGGAGQKVCRALYSWGLGVALVNFRGPSILSADAAFRNVTRRYPKVMSTKSTVETPKAFAMDDKSFRYISVVPFSKSDKILWERPLMTEMYSISSFLDILNFLTFDPTFLRKIASCE